MRELTLPEVVMQTRADMTTCKIPDTPETHDVRMKELRRMRALRSSDSRAAFQDCYGHAPEVTGA